MHLFAEIFLKSNFIFKLLVKSFAKHKYPCKLWEEMNHVRKYVFLKFPRKIVFILLTLYYRIKIIRYVYYIRNTLYIRMHISRSLCTVMHGNERFPRNVRTDPTKSWQDIRASCKQHCLLPLAIPKDCTENCKKIISWLRCSFTKKCTSSWHSYNSNV